MNQEAARLLELEELGLEVGDSIYYRFIARDFQPDDKNATAYSQPFFLTIRPFEQVFYEGRAGGGGGGGGTPLPDQRQVIVSTTRLADRFDELDETERTELSEDIARSQRAIRMRYQGIREGECLGVKIDAPRAGYN